MISDLPQVSPTFWSCVATRATTRANFPDNGRSLTMVRCAGDSKENRLHLLSILWPHQHLKERCRMPGPSLCMRDADSAMPILLKRHDFRKVLNIA